MGGFALYDGSGGGTWASVLAAGATSSGTDPIISSGDTLRGAAAATGGALPLQGGAGTAGIGGVVTVTGGTGSAGNAGGAVTVIGGSSDTTGGAVSIRGGPNTTTGAGGTVLIAGGLPTSGNGSAVIIAGSSGATSGNGGAVIVTSGAGATNGNGGSILFSSGNSAGSGTGGAFTVTAGSGGATGTGGAINLTSGAGGATSGAGGNIVITAASAATSGAGGTIQVLAGDGTGGNNLGGDLTLAAGDAVGGSAGGTAQLLGGEGGATGGGGTASLIAGNGGITSGNGGLARVLGGTPTDGEGGQILILGANGVGSNRAGGIVTITAGTATGSGTGGNVALSSGTSPSGTSGAIVFNTGTTGATTERARWTPNGTLYIGDGTASAAVYPPAGSTDSAILAYRSGSGCRQTIQAYSTTATDAPAIILERGRGTAAVPAVPQSGDSLGNLLVFGGATATVHQLAFAMATVSEATFTGSNCAANTRIYVGTPTAGTAVERVRFGSAGTTFFGGGTLSATAAFGGNGDATVAGHSYRDTSCIVYIDAYSVGAVDDAGILGLRRGRGVASAPSAVVSGDSVGRIVFDGVTTASTVNRFSEIRCEVDGAVASGDAPGRIVIYTTPDGTSTGVERMRITNGGTVYLGNGVTAASPNASTLTGTGHNGTGAGANMTISAGAGGTTSGAGGQLAIRGGNATAGASNGGATSISSGSGSTSGSSGNISIQSGVPGTTGASGALTVGSASGGATSGASGAITLFTGGSTSGNTGTIAITSGDAVSGNSGNISIITGTASSTVGTVSFGVADVAIWIITSSGNLEKQVLGDFILTERSITPRTADLGLAHTNSWGVFTNEGAGATVNFTLPTASAGMEFEFFVMAAQTLRVTAAAGDTIRIAASESAAAGNIANNVVGSYVKITALNATNWVAAAVVGTWTVT